MGPGLAETIKPADFTGGRFGLPTVRDIIAELETGMVLEGTVSNGAFVDIGVHQDGLVHFLMFQTVSSKFLLRGSPIFSMG